MASFEGSCDGSTAPALAAALPPTKFLFVGNPGVGKSTLANGLAVSLNGGRQPPPGSLFQSGLSLGSGLTRQLQSIDIGEHTIMDTPGLSDVLRVKEAGAEITKALKQGGTFKVVFVIVENAGRIGQSEIATMSAVLEAAPEIGSNYGVIINQMSSEVKRMYEEDLAERKMGKASTLLVLFNECLPEFSAKIELGEEDLDLKSNPPPIKQLPDLLLSFLLDSDACPSVILNPKCVQEVNTATMEEKKEELDNLRNIIEKDKQAHQKLMSELEVKHAREIQEARESARGRRGGGCVIL